MLTSSLISRYRISIGRGEETAAVDAVHNEKFGKASKAETRNLTV